MVKKNDSGNYSCIIPVHNEEKTGMGPLEEVSKIKDMDKVVCVDDGSTDDSAKIIKEKFPDFELVQLKENKGKAEAIRQGLKRINTEYLLLVDADLKNLDKKEIEYAIKKTRNNEPDMVILKRINAPSRLKLFRLNTLLSGERILKTDELRKILGSGCQGYEIEVATNEYMIKNNKKVFWSPHSGRNVIRKKKWEIHKNSYLKMYMRNLDYLGMVSALRQITTFCRKRI